MMARTEAWNDGPEKGQTLNYDECFNRKRTTWWTLGGDSVAV